MLRLHGVVAEASEPDVAARLHGLDHAGGLERLFVPEEDLGRRRFRLVTDKGTDCAVTLERDDVLRDGSVLLLEAERAIVVRIGAMRLWRLRPRSIEAALQLGFQAGHLHWRARFEGGDLLVHLDGPVDNYRARLAALLGAGDVVDVDAA